MSTPSFRNIWVTWDSTVRGDVKVVGNRLVGQSFGDQFEDVVLATRQRGEWIIIAATAEQSGDDGRVDHSLAVAEAAQSIDERRGGEDALFQQVADLLG